MATIRSTAPAKAPTALGDRPNTKEEACCPVCRGVDLGHISGYAFTSVPDPTPTWLQFAWCENCGWEEEWADGLMVSTVTEIQPTTVAITDLDDDLPPF